MIKDSTPGAIAQSLGEGGRGSSSLGLPLPIGVRSASNRVLLAPLSGISDVPFRGIARRFGAGLVVSEMVASGEFVRGDAESLLRAMRDGEGVHVVQLAGRNPVWMKAAAERLAALGADIIDINMGCPAKKVVGGMSGSALMREPELALALIEATVAGADDVPVTLKMRLGWDAASINAPWLAVRAEAAGVRMIAVHGRTRAQFYTGRADWHAIAAVKAQVRVPVVANGDLVDLGQEQAMLAASGADAVMIGRGACGRPWLPGLMAGAPGAARLGGIGFADLVREHVEAMLDHYGARAGMRNARKHLGWYLDRFSALAGRPVAAERRAVLTSDRSVAVLAVLSDLFGQITVQEIEAATVGSERREAA